MKHDFSPLTNHLLCSNDMVPNIMTPAPTFKKCMPFLSIIVGSISLRPLELFFDRKLTILFFIQHVLYFMKTAIFFYELPEATLNFLQKRFDYKKFIFLSKAATRRYATRSGKCPASSGCIAMCRRLKKCCCKSSRAKSCFGWH